VVGGCQSPFLSPERIQSLRQDMAGDNGLLAQMRAGGTSSCIQSPEWLRFCPLCSEEDEKQHGNYYWHRLHQVPGVEVCPTHQVFLENSNVRGRGRRIRYELVSAQQAIQRVSPRSLNLSNPLHQNLHQLARDVAWLLNQPNFVPGLESIRDRYLSLLIERGLANYSGIVRVRQLLEAFKKYYPSDLLKSLQCQIAEQDNNNWLFRLVRSPKQSRHPLYHLLLIHFLGHSVETFFQLSDELKPFGNAPWPCLNPVCNYFRQPCIQECQIKYDKIHGGRLTGTFRCCCGFTYSRMEPDESPEDRFQVGKVKTWGYVWEAALKEVWEEPTLSLMAMAAKLGVDPQTVKHQAARLNLVFPRPGPTAKQLQINTTLLPETKETEVAKSTKLEEYRTEWLTALKENSDVGRTELAEKLKRIYSWLYLYDKKWLKAHLPPLKKREKCANQANWQARDSEVAAKVRISAERLKTVPGKPERVTKTAIASDSGYLALIQKQLDKLPDTAKILTEVAETREEFAIRRIQWAAECFRQEGTCPKRWQLLRRSGLKSNIEGVPLVEKAIAAALASLDPLGTVSSTGTPMSK